MKNHRLPILALAIAVVGVGAVTPTAFATPPFKFNVTPLVTADLDNTVNVRSDGVKLQTRKPTDVMIQKIVLEPGGTSGWHHHPGMVLIAVESGSVTLWDSRCHKTTYGPRQPNGAAFTESGNGAVQVTSEGGSTVYATFIAPSADPHVFRIEDEVPRCAK